MTPLTLTSTRVVFSGSASTPGSALSTTKYGDSERPGSCGARSCARPGVTNMVAAAQATAASRRTKVLDMACSLRRLRLDGRALFDPVGDERHPVGRRAVVQFEFDRAGGEGVD